MSDSSFSGRQLLNASHERPAKPRRRPANLVFNTSIPETPALSSPSASEASSRFSLETVSTGARPGHARGKSSLGVVVQATIKEEPSLATLRNVALGAAIGRQPSWCETEDDEPTVTSVKHFVEWKREADDEYRRTRACWTDSEESKHAVAGESIICWFVSVLTEEFKLPMTNDEIVKFLAQSAQAYKPLEQLDNARVHRRKSSLGQRQMFSPYGLPLPKPPSVTENKPKMSLITKFERTKSSTSSGCSWDNGAVLDSTPTRAPLSAVFAQFAQLPASPARAPISAPIHGSSGPSPFAALTSLDANVFGSKGSTPPIGTSTSDAKMQAAMAKGKRDSAPLPEERRSRVDSDARRVALGWGRRRNSDGPTKVEQMARKYEEQQSMRDLPKDLCDAVRDSQIPRIGRISQVGNNRDKENAAAPAGPALRSSTFAPTKSGRAVRSSRRTGPTNPTTTLRPLRV